MDLKEAGNHLYLVGETHEELGGSHLALIHELDGGQVPKLDPEKALTLFRELHLAIRQGAVRSCHDLSEGGLAVAAAEMTFAGGLGATLSLNGINDELSDAALLFSESNTRFLVEVPQTSTSEFEACFASARVTLLGKVTSEDRLVITGRSGQSVIDSSMDSLKNAWQATFAEF